jgi:hypothetical protein
MEVSGCGRKRMKKASEISRSPMNFSPYPRLLKRTGTMLSRLSKRVYLRQ